MKIEPGQTIGILGGGQLGKMMAIEASKLGYRTFIYTNTPDSPALQIASDSIIDSYTNEEALSTFADICDVITIEFENIPYKTALLLEKKKPFHPNSHSLYLAQNRIREKEFFQSLGMATAPFTKIKDLKEASMQIGFPSILKTVELGYDGKGQIHLNSWEDLPKTIFGPSILEKKIPFLLELSVIATRTPSGEFSPFTPAENIHQEGILNQSIAPAQIPFHIQTKAMELTKQLMDAMSYVGTIGVEFFLTDGEELLVNEFAPRPHNSGHWTIDACLTNQFEQHIRAICSLPLGNPALHHQAEMRNLIGEEVNSWQELIKSPNRKLHIYGKNEIKQGRKMGHVTTLSPIESQKESPLEQELARLLY